jgi:hypothetical protein
MYGFLAYSRMIHVWEGGIGYVITMAFIYNVEMSCSTCGILFTFEWNLCGVKLNPKCNLDGTTVS